MKQNIAVGIIKPSVGGGGNSSNVFGAFQSFSKGLFNCVVNTGPALEPGDIVHYLFKDVNTFWPLAIYNGGNILDTNNYTPFGPEVTMDNVCGLPDPIPDGGGTDPDPDPDPTPTYCVNWTASNDSNIKMATQGYIDFTEMLAGRFIHTAASSGTITAYIIAGMTPVACSIPMEFTPTRAVWEYDLPATADKVLTSLVYTVNIIFTNGTEYDIINGQTNAIVEPDPQLSSSYNSCGI